MDSAKLPPQHHQPPVVTTQVQYGMAPMMGNPVFVQAIVVGDSPQTMTCPHCQHVVTTSISHNNGTFTHVLAAILCVVGCWPCCLIPYCVDEAKDTEHVCPNCHRFIGVRRRL